MLLFSATVTLLVVLLLALMVDLLVALLVDLLVALLLDPLVALLVSKLFIKQLQLIQNAAVIFLTNTIWLFSIPRTRTKAGKPELSVYAHQLWNKLSDNMGCAETVESFKSGCKTGLLQLRLITESD